MKTSKEYPRFEWKEFFDLWQQVNELLRRKAEGYVIADRLEEYKGTGHGFGSSDRSHTIFGAFSHPDYNEDAEEKWSLPTTADEMLERVKNFLRERVAREGLTGPMVELFLDEPDKMAAMLLPSKRSVVLARSHVDSPVGVGDRVFS